MVEGGSACQAFNSIKYMTPEITGILSPGICFNVCWYCYNIFSMGVGCLVDTRGLEIFHNTLFSLKSHPALWAAFFRLRGPF